LLPGMMCDARLFRHQMELGDIVVPAIPPVESMTEIAKLLLQDLPDRFALGGLSMGGIIAMEILAQAPERVAGLALLDTNPLAELDEVKARRVGQMAAARDGRLAQVMRDELKPNYLVDGPQKPEILDLCMAMALDLGAEVFCAQSIALRDRPDQTDTLRGFAGPALVLCGAEDTLCPLSRHELMHELMPQSALVVVEGAGHLPVLEQPDATNAALKAWMEKIDE